MFFVSSSAWGGGDANYECGRRLGVNKKKICPRFRSTFIVARASFCFLPTFWPLGWIISNKAMWYSSARHTVCCSTNCFIYMSKVPKGILCFTIFCVFFCGASWNFFYIFFRSLEVRNCIKIKFLSFSQPYCPQPSGHRFCPICIPAYTLDVRNVWEQFLFWCSLKKKNCM